MFENFSGNLGAPKWNKINFGKEIFLISRSLVFWILLGPQRKKMLWLQFFFWDPGPYRPPKTQNPKTKTPKRPSRSLSAFQFYIFGLSGMYFCLNTRGLTSNRFSCPRVAKIHSQATQISEKMHLGFLAPTPSTGPRVPKKNNQSEHFFLSGPNNIQNTRDLEIKKISFPKFILSHLGAFRFLEKSQTFWKTRAGGV